VFDTGERVNSSTNEEDPWQQSNPYPTAIPE
jgi:hypothetical protein